MNLDLRIVRLLWSGGLYPNLEEIQGLRSPPQKKYQDEGGPGIPEIMEILRYSEDPDEDRDRFMRAQALNFVVANTDAHAKNYSILYAQGGRFRLAPLYDVACLGAYHEGRSNLELAMTIGGERLLERVKPKNWTKVATNAGYEPDRALAHVRDLLAKLPGMTLAVRAVCAQQRLDLKIIDSVVEALWARAKLLSGIYGAEFMP